jgi:hypothetical protein
MRCKKSKPARLGHNYVPDPALEALLAEQELDDDVEEEEHQTHHSAGKPASL